MSIVLRLLDRGMARGALIALVVLLAGCESLLELPGFGRPAREPLPPAPVNEVSGAVNVEPGTELSRSIKRTLKEPAQTAAAGAGWQVKGSGRFIDEKPLKHPETAKLPAFDDKKEITLNFENTDIREVVKVILGDMLKLNYIINPAVRGGVSMQTAAPISRSELLPTLETLLRMNNATLVWTDGRQYQVVPVAKATKGLLTPRLAEEREPLPSGHNLVIRPLHNIGADEMADILKPLVRDNSIVRVDPRRNLLLLAGSARGLEQILSIIDTFDVNWLKGLSVGFFPLHNNTIEQVQKDLDVVLGGEAGKALGGLVRITPIPSANGLLVVTPQKDYLAEVGKWIRQFDRRSQAGDEQRIFIYRVRNGKAEDLAKLLNELFAKKSKTATLKRAVAPGLSPVELVGKAAEGETAARKTVIKSTENVAPEGGGGATLTGDVRVVADVEHNSLLILASARDYRKMLDTLEKLDIIPLQVHIEATIVEVLLKGHLKYGISWFFQGGVGGGYDSTVGTGGVDSSVSGVDITDGIDSLLNGFNWSLMDSTGNIRAVLNAFANDSLVNVLSAPSVMVLDNQEATIQVGDEVPTLSQRQATEGGLPVETVNYRNTGIILKVKPRVNPGGLVTMEVSQEVSAVVQTEVSTNHNQPTIQTRKISSTVAVQSGHTVVLGGLIRDKRSNAQGGVPGFYKVPVLGALFGGTENRNERVELMVVLTPRVITSAEDALQITHDFRDRMQGLKKEFLAEAGVIERNPPSKGAAQGGTEEPADGNREESEPKRGVEK
ncbi:MAG: type II secretion system protein GspD [Gammaproteobacteria bacterium]|nr:MAG: type II secretion system protein GspD [Gammaproteobacteria bacterium]